jgi:hypothetical protein
MRLVSAAAGLVGFLLLLSFGAYAFFSPSIETPGAVLGALGVLGLGLWLWLDRDVLQRAARSQGARFTGASILVVLVSAGIAVALNVLAHRYDERIDLTEAGTYTLSDETEKIVRALDRPVEVVAFVSEATPEKGRIDELLASYKALSDKLTVRDLDPIRHPMEAEQHKITSDLATVILVSGSDQQRVENTVNEEAITNAIVRLTSGTAHRICTTIGHRELDGEDDFSPSGMGAALTKLRGLNYKVDKVNLARDPLQGRRPDDPENEADSGENGPCEVLIAADPQTDFLPMEREIVARFVAEGNAFLLMLDPTHAPALAKDMARYGILVDDDIVVEDNPDMQVAGMDASYIVLDSATFDYHPLTEGLKGMVLFRVARSVRKAPVEGADPAASTGFKVQEVAKTSVHGWGEITLDMSKALQPDPGEDILGPVPLLVVSEVEDASRIQVGATTMGADQAASDYPSILAQVEGRGSGSGAAAAPTAPAFTPKAGGKVVVFGDSDFASNQLVDQLTNKDLLLNTIAWMVGEEDQLAVRSKGGEGQTLTMTVGQSLVVWLLSVLVAPGVAMLGALLTWRMRRAL